MNKALIFLLALSLATKGTYAYIDPGTGSYILQILLAGVFGTLITFGNLRTKIVTAVKNIFKKDKPKNTKPNESA
jgi:hypothetical protein